MDTGRTEIISNLDLESMGQTRPSKVGDTHVDSSSAKGSEDYSPSPASFKLEEDVNLLADDGLENKLESHEMQTGQHINVTDKNLEESDDEWEKENDEKHKDDDDDDDDDDVEDSDDGVPIDRGWAWMVTLGSFIIFLLVPGYNVVLSVLLLDIVDFYDTSVTSVTVMQSSCCLIQSIACQLAVNMLLPKMSVRLVSIVAAVVNAATSLLVVTSPNMAVFSVLQVIKFAVHGAMLTPSLALVGLYFKRRRALASSIALLGLSFASILVPLMVRYLREEYGFKGCFLLLSAYEMHGIFAASLLRPITSYRKHKKSTKQQDQHGDSSSNLNEEKIEVFKSLLEEKHPHQGGKLIFGRYLEPLTSANSGSTKTISVICDHKVKDTCQCSSNLVTQIKDDNFNVLSDSKNHLGSIDVSNKHSTVNGRASSVQTLQRVGAQISNSKSSWVSRLTLTPSLMASSVNFSHSQDSVTSVKKEIKTSTNLCVKIMKSILDFSLLKVRSSLTCILGYILGRSGTLIVIYLPSYATEVGLTKSQAAILVIIYGAVDMFSRVAFGYVGDLHLTQPRFIISCTTLLMGVVACLGGFFDTFGTLVFFASALGLFGSVVLSLNTSNITDMVGLDKLGPVLAFESLSLTLSWTIQFPVLGVMIETTSTFASVFYFASVSYVLATACLLSDIFWFRCHTRGSKDDDL